VKILMLTMAMNIGGAETHILELCRRLKDGGHDVTLASNGGVYADELVRCGLRHVSLPFHSKAPACVAKAYCGLKKLLTEEKFDIVHAHARIPAFICSLLREQLIGEGGYKFRFVTTTHLNFPVNPLWRRISRWGEYTMAVSEDIADYLVKEYAYPRDRIHTTINGVDCEKFSPHTDCSSLMEQYGLDSSHRRIVYMSRLDADRADPAFRLLHIGKALSEQYPDVDIVLVGGGTELEKIQREAQAVNEAVGRSLFTVTGPVSNVNEHCALADVFVGVSRSTLEAMAAAKPVIVAGNQGSLGIFDRTKIEPAVATNFCCRGFDVATEEDLLRDLSALLDASGEELRAMGQYNRDFVLERYTTARMAEDYVHMYEEALSSPVSYVGSPDILISGYYGFGNLGDESLLDIIAKTFAREAPGVKIAALTRRPKKDRRRTGLKCISRINVPGYFYHVKRAKLLLSGGGSLLQDTTSKRSLRYYISVIRGAQLHKTKVAVLANGIGPISDPACRQLTGKVLSTVDHISVRDPQSAAELKKLGVTVPIDLRADPAFLIQGAKESRLGALRANLGLRGDYFVVSLRKMPTNRKNNGLSLRLNEEILEGSVAFCNSIAEKYGLTPVILPMQESWDKEICRALADRVPTSVLYSPAGAADLIGILKGARFVVGMRLHAVIFASSAGVPVIGLSYDPKVEAMMEALGQPYVVCVKEEDVTREQIAARVKEDADLVMENREAIVAALGEKAEAMRQACREDVRKVATLLQ